MLAGGDRVDTGSCPGQTLRARPGHPRRAGKPSPTKAAQRIVRSDTRLSDCLSVCLSIYLFVVLEFELWASHLLDRYSHTLPSLRWLFLRESLMFLPGLVLPASPL
jgi:hypothetical protein